MSLAHNVSALATCVAQELKTRIHADHAGLAKAWVCFGWTRPGRRGNLVIAASYNVRKVKRIGKGRYQLYFEAEMPDLHYGWHAQGQHPAWIRWLAPASTRITAKALSRQCMEIRCSTLAGWSVDPVDLHLTIWR